MFSVGGSPNFQRVPPDAVSKTITETI